MGAIIRKPRADGNGVGGSTYSASAQAHAIDGIPLGQCVSEGILNLEHRSVNNEAFARISAVHILTRQVLSLSLANNRITALVFDQENASGGSGSGAVTTVPRTSDPPPPITAPSNEPTNPTHSTLGASPQMHGVANAPGLLDGEDPDDDFRIESSVHRQSIGGSTGPKPLPAPSAPLRSSVNWPILENLDLSGNNELYNYAGLATVTATLRSLRLAHNGIFKVPREVWGLSNLTKLDLSHNRLLVLPPGISLLTKLNSLKLAHNSLVANATSSCIPEEMRFCTRLRRLDLSYNKLRELPVNYRVDKENTTRRSLVGMRPSNASATAAAAATIASASAVPAATSSLTSSPSQPHSHAPVPIKYFDPNRVSYIQITLLNLSNNQIDSLSPSIGLLRSLNSLNLGYNKLRSLPTEIALLSELKYLDLRFNQLPSLLTEICLLPRLSKLCLQNNKITGLPYEIKKLKKLTHFFLSSNQLIDLPDVIAEVRSVRVLKLCNNKLLTIPDSLFRLPKLRLLDLSFNKLTYLSRDVCDMPLLEDLRLWGNKIADIPTPILHSDCKKIIAYLRATERERYVIAHQMRSLQGPRSQTRLASVKGLGASPRPNARAQSATRAHSQFAPLGFYDERENGNVSSNYLAPASAITGSAGMHSSRSVNSMPGRSPTLGFGSATSPSLNGHGRRLKQAGGGGDADSGSETEEGMGSDDEFTSMFRAASGASSRTMSFTNLAPTTAYNPNNNGLGVQTQSSTTVTSGNASRASSAAPSRRSTFLTSARASPRTLGPPTSSNTNASITTIVQPFQQSAFSLSVAASAPLSSSARGSARSSTNALQAIRDGYEPEYEHEHERERQRVGHDDDFADDDTLGGAHLRSHMQSPDASSSDVLTDLVRREWQPIHDPNAASTASSDPLFVPARSSPTQQAQASNHELMDEWDKQSEVIDKQHTGRASARIGNY